jgi:hypothetical protein
VCFLALAALAGLAAGGGSHWALRLPLAAATPVLAIGVWWQLSQRDGWPTGNRPADGSAFVAGVVQAPTSSSAGAIYLWAQPPNSEAPRSYRLPYTPQLERQVAQAAHAAKRGVHVGVRATSRAHRPRRGGGRPSPSASLRFYRLSPPHLQTKEGSAAPPQ